MSLTKFEVTAEHLTLLRNMYVGWQDDEFGAPEIDPKRPYGNSSALIDIAELLDVPLPNEERDEWFAPEVEKWLRRLHRETQTALQIALETGTFAAGHYERANPYNGKWTPSPLPDTERGER